MPARSGLVRCTLAKQRRTPGLLCFQGFETSAVLVEEASKTRMWPVEDNVMQAQSCDYTVRFCNQLVNCNGQLFSTCQREIVVQGIPDEADAIQAAKLEFERLERVGSWRARATSIECLQTDPSAAGESRSVRSR